MVRIPSRSNPTDGAPAQDDSGGGQTDERDRSATKTWAPSGERSSDSTTYQGGSAVRDSGSAPAWFESDRQSTDRAAEARPPQAGQPGPEPQVGTTAANPDTMPEHRPDEEVTVVAGPRPRASLLATLSLIFGVAAVLFVLTGTLAAYGIGLGAVALLLSFAGMSATGRRHIAGKSDALLGLLLGLGAVGLGVLAITGQFGWPNTDADTVQRFREWLDAQTVDRF